MKKKLTLWILLVPGFIFAQVQVKDGALTIDFSKKKNKQEQVDSTQQQNIPDEDEDEQPAKVKKVKAAKTENSEDDFNFKRDGLFKAMFIAGLNLSQIDGDEQAGYTYPGARAGVGVMVRFHKYMSVNTGIIYSMKGAYKKLNANETPQQTFRVQWDYVQVPLMFNVHDKKLFMASVGLGFNYQVRNKVMHQIDSLNTGLREITNSALKTPEPNKFDLTGMAGFQFLIKKVFGIGAQFEYSFIGLRPSAGLNTKVKKMYNNTITIQLMYILDPVAIKKKRKGLDG